MFSDYSKRAKTTNVSSNNSSNQYQGPQQNTYRNIYVNQSPAYTNKYQYEEQSQRPYIRHIHYYHRQKPSNDFYDEDQNLEKTMKNKGSKGAYYFKEFKNMKDSVEKDKNFVQRSVNTLTNQNQSKLNDKYYNIENNKNKNSNIIKSQNEKHIINNYKKNFDNQGYQGEEKEKYAPKFYRNNNPLIKINIEKNENNITPVAQKICNIIIKGEAKNKKLKSDKKKEKKFDKNIQIEGNVAQGSTIPDKNINFNLNSKNNFQSKLNETPNPSKDENNEENENENDNEEVEEKEEGTNTVSEDKKEYDSSNKK